MIGNIFRRNEASIDMATTHLFDSSTFYEAFKKDLSHCKSEVIIESPFITLKRLDDLLPVIRQALARGVTVTINTKPPHENDNYMHYEAEVGVARLQNLGVNVLFTGGHHRKIAILDRSTLWEGSLNILSQSNSCEIMRRIESKVLGNQMLDFIGIRNFL